MCEQVNYHDEAVNHQLPMAVAFWIIWIVSMGECSSLMLNLMQIRCSTCSAILNAKATHVTQWHLLPIFTSSQDGGIGRYTLLPRTTKRRTTMNLKTKNKQNCQKIKLYGSPTTKELKKKHSSRPVRGAEMGNRSEDSRQGSGWCSRRSHICMQINREEQLGVRQTAQPRVPAWGNKASERLTDKTCGGCSSGRTSQPHMRVRWRDPQGPRM